MEIFPLFWVGEGRGGSMGMDLSKAIRQREKYFIVLLVSQTTKEGLRTKFGLMLGTGSVIERIILGLL